MSGELLFDRKDDTYTDRGHRVFDQVERAVEKLRRDIEDDGEVDLRDLNLIVIHAANHQFYREVMQKRLS